MWENNILITEMMKYYTGDPKRIQHFIKVYQFAKMIGELEKLPEEVQYILETAAIVHDIGIKPAEEKYGSCGGKLQEQEGPAAAEEMLQRLGYRPEVIDRVCYLWDIIIPMIILTAAITGFSWRPIFLLIFMRTAYQRRP